MSIQHLDDLTTEEMLDFVAKIPNGSVSTKLDGANLWVGVDAQGVYVSREGKNKSSPKIYTPGDFEDVAPNDQFKAALQALQAVKSKLEMVISPSEMIEIEVIFGQQPNVIKYHENNQTASIVFLRGVKGADNEKVQKLTNLIGNQNVVVDSEIKTSSDGVTLSTDIVKVTFNFFSNKRVPASKVIDLNKCKAEIDQLKNLGDAPSEIDGVSNSQLEQQKTTEENKRAKIDSQLQLNKAKQKLKMNLYRQIESGFGDDTDKEGYVVTLGDKMFKLVDKEKFVSTNVFYQKHRKMAVSTILTTDPMADSTKRGGVVGQVKIELAKFLGKPELARAQSAKQMIKEIGNQEFLKQFQIPDLNAAKIKMLAILDRGISILKIQSSRFLKTKGGQIEIAGNAVSYTEPVIARTNVAFAEANIELNKIRELIASAKSTEDLVYATFGRFVELNKSIKEERSNMISYMLLEDDAPAETSAEPAATQPTPDKTSAGDISTKEMPVVGSGRYKFVMRKRNDSVLTAMKKKKLKIKD